MPSLRFSFRDHLSFVGRRKYRTRCDCQFARHIVSTWVHFSWCLSWASAPVRSKKTSVRSKKKKKQKNSKKKVRRRTERRRQQQRRGKFQRASLMFFSYTRINCRFGLALKPIKQQSLQKHNRSAFLCICRFGDWNFNYTATLATKTFRLLPPWRVLLKRFFEPCLSGDP